MKSNLYQKFVLFFLLLFMQRSLIMAQPDTITFNNHKLNTEWLTPGLKQYLVYSYNSKQPKMIRSSIWTRNVSLTERKGEKLYTVNQKWFSNDTTTYREVFSINKTSDFSPVYHSESIGGKTKAYNWYDDKIAGADTVSNNEANQFMVNLKTPAYNWNLDIETFEMMPLAANKIFVLYFYDAGYDVPNYITYKVIGSETLVTLDNKQADCWMLQTAGKFPNGTPFTQTFWISQKGHEFLKEADEFGGSYRVKIKLSAFAPEPFLGIGNK